jgi:hypothetical protein
LKLTTREGLGRPSMRETQGPSTPLRFGRDDMI